MKLARVGNPDKEKPIIIDKDNNYRDVSSVIKDFNSDNLNFETLEKLKNIKPEDLPILDKSVWIGSSEQFVKINKNEDKPIWNNSLVKFIN